MMSAPAAAWPPRSAHTAPESRRCRPSPLSSRNPQCPWSVYSQRQQSAMSDARVTETLAQRADRLLDNTRPPQMRPIPARPWMPAARRAGRRRGRDAIVSSTVAHSESMLSWFCPGIDPIGCGDCRPSRMNAGWINWPGVSLVSRARRRSAGVRRRRRGRSEGKSHVADQRSGWGCRHSVSASSSPSTEALSATAATVEAQRHAPRRPSARRCRRSTPLPARLPPPPPRRGGVRCSRWSG